MDECGVKAHKGVNLGIHLKKCVVLNLGFTFGVSALSLKNKSNYFINVYDFF
jgi:hypothetical protein